MRRWIAIYLKGCFMGAADMVPGVSGGTIALITGIYERLVRAITNVDPRLAVHLLRPHDADARAALLEGLRRMDPGFLLALGAGILTAVLVVSRVVGTLIDAYPAATAAFFLGLIGASAIVLSRQITLDARRAVAIGSVGVLLAGGSVAATGGDVPHALPIVFLAGTIAISAMVLPGVSGAFFLLLLGQYDYMLDTLTAFVDSLLALASGGGLAPVIRHGVVVATFLAGAAIGLLSVAHAIRWALERYRMETLTFLVALMVGGLAVPGAQIAAEASPTAGGVAGVLGGIALGAGAVLALDRYTDDLEYARDGGHPARQDATEREREVDCGVSPATSEE